MLSSHAPEAASLEHSILMADQQRIHPVPNPEAPLVNRSSLRSEKGDPEQHRLSPYPYPKPPKKNFCCRCLCCTLCFILLLIILIVVLAAIIYFVFQPKIPKYSIDSMSITQFNLNNDMSLYATFNVNIKANNPNTKIGIYYETGSNLIAYFKGTELCEGSLPKFYQGHMNVTQLSLILTGQIQDATDLLQSLQAQQQTGSIPLDLKAKVPVRLKLGALKLMTWNCFVKCLLNVDSLTADNVIRIRDSSCKFRFRL